jgi:succinoglycan biosynthesis protein ExoL
MRQLYVYTGNPGPGMLDLLRVSLRHFNEVDLLFFDRGVQDILPDFKGVNSVTRHRVGYNGIGIKRFFYTPFLMFLIFRKVIRFKPDLVNIHTLDTLFIVSLIRIFVKFRIIYQIRDLHFLQYSDCISCKLIRVLERVCLTFVDNLLVSSPGFKRFYEQHYNYNGMVTILENIPREEIVELAHDKVTSRNEQKFVIGYIGIVRYIDSLKALVHACNLSNNRDIELYIAGGGDKEFLKDLNPDISVTCFDAFVYIDSIAKHYSSVDVIYAVYDHLDFNCQVAMPNKFYEAILFKKPIIVSSGTYLAERVEELGIGMVVNIETDFSNIFSDLKWVQIAINNLCKINFSDYVNKYESQLLKSIT